jgi:NADP-dependent 3-hydroxy acid dehydrogenase YdfG
MPKTIVVVGYGPGISKAVAEKFGAKGFAVALVARSADKLAAGVKELEAKGIKAAAVQANVGDPSGARDAIKNARAALGPVTVLQWTAYDGGAGDLTSADSAAIRGVLDVGITGLLAAVQESLPDLRKQENAAILVTNGGLGYFDPQVDDAAVAWNAMGLAVANSAKHKLVGLLSKKLAADKIYVGEAMVLNTVKGTAFDSGQASIDAATVADKFWELYQARGEVTGQVQ